MGGNEMQIISNEVQNKLFAAGFKVHNLISEFGDAFVILIYKNLQTKIVVPDYIRGEKIIAHMDKLVLLAMKRMEKIEFMGVDPAHPGTDRAGKINILEGKV